MKYEKRIEEAEDHKDQYHEDRNAEYNLGAKEVRNCSGNSINDQVKGILQNYMNQKQLKRTR